MGLRDLRVRRHIGTGHVQACPKHQDARVLSQQVDAAVAEARSNQRLDLVDGEWRRTLGVGALAPALRTRGAIAHTAVDRNWIQARGVAINLSARVHEIVECDRDDF
jgi:hypothetical protein